MITMDEFFQGVKQKFKEELWIDYEARFFGNDVYIKGGIDLIYSHRFELYIENAQATNIDELWTVDLPDEDPFYFQDKKLTFVSDDGLVIDVTGEVFWGCLQTGAYNELTQAMFEGSLLLSSYFVGYDDVTSLKQLEQWERFVKIDF